MFLHQSVQVSALCEVHDGVKTIVVLEGDHDLSNEWEAVRVELREQRELANRYAGVFSAIIILDGNLHGIHRGGCVFAN